MRFSTSKAIYSPLETDPTCTSNTSSNAGMVGDVIKYTCSLKYNGTWAPSMSWLNETVELQAKDESQGGTAKFTTTITLMPWDNGRNYSCRTVGYPKVGTSGVNEEVGLPVDNDTYTEMCTMPTLTVRGEY